MWLVAEIRTALQMAQAFIPGNQFYNLLRAQHVTVNMLTTGKTRAE